MSARPRREADSDRRAEVPGSIPEVSAGARRSGLELPETFPEVCRCRKSRDLIRAELPGNPHVATKGDVAMWSLVMQAVGVSAGIWLVLAPSAGRESGRIATTAWGVGSVLGLLVS
jgi:hypothetical protein